jgi:hypothetical protein
LEVALRDIWLWVDSIFAGKPRFLGVFKIILAKTGTALHNATARRKEAGMRRIPLLVIALLGFAVLAVPAFADSVCGAGNFSNLVGTSCDIGGLKFTFTGVSSYGGGWTASDLYFTPAAKGFTLSFLGGPQSFSANNPNPLGNVSFSELGLSFNVSAPQGYYFNGVNVTSAEVFSASGIYAFASGGLFAQSTAGGAGRYVLCAFNDCDTVSAFYPAMTPYSATASADLIVFDLWAGSGTASWNGSPSTFTMSLDNNVPEPNSSVLLALELVIVCGCGFVMRKRIA